MRNLCNFFRADCCVTIFPGQSATGRWGYKWPTAAVSSTGTPLTRIQVENRSNQQPRYTSYCTRIQVANRSGQLPRYTSIL